MKTPTHTEVQPHAFLDDCSFVTNDGRTGVVIRLRPLDSECMEAVEVKATTHIFRMAIKVFGAGTVVYQYLLKRKVSEIRGSDTERARYLTEKGLYRFDFYIAVLRDGVDRHGAKRSAESFCQQVKESLRAELVDKEEAFILFRRLLNYDDGLAQCVGLNHNEHIGYFASDSDIEAHRGLLRVGHHWTKVMTLKDPPKKYTDADLLKPLREMDCEFIAVTEWRPIDLPAARSLITSKVTHFHRQKTMTGLAAGIVNAIAGLLGGQERQRERPEDMQKDESAIAMEKQLGELLVDVEKNGAQVGEFAMSIILFDLDKARVEKLTAGAVKALAVSGAVFFDEVHGTLPQWFAALPGGRKHQHRTMWLTDANYADLSMLFAPDTGNPMNEHLKAECLAVMETRQKTPFYANLHVLDVGHAPIIGKTGSGKTFMCNHLLRSALRYNPQIVVLDIGGSYKRLCSEVGGAYVEVGLDNPFTINPFCLPDTSANRKFMFTFVKVLIETGGYKMTVIEKEALYKALRGNRRLSDLAARLPESLQPYIGRWVGDGQYGELFDNEQDTLTYSRFQVFEFEDSEEGDETLEPLLFYILHRASEVMKGSGFKVMLLDEAWKLLENDSIRRYVRRGLKTWRKRNAAMWTATQSMEDMESTNMLETIVENSGSMVFLPNPKMNREQYRKVFKLNEVELDYVLTMTMAKESMWKPAQGPSKVVILNAGETK